MNSLRPESAAAMTAHRREAVRLAKAQEKAVFDKCARSNQEVPAYMFDELIGKGSFGRVYKGRQNSTGKIVAIKVLDIDDADFQAFGDQKDEQIRDFNREIQILRRAQDSGAKNLNQMIEALPVHSQLWLICEYCPGGSVKTLMRATNDRLSEKYLVVVARELAKALEGLHHAGIMHRDVKAANVLIHENGGLQLCDFGVAATLEGGKDKRRTFIGTLHWMPPELWDDQPQYSDEVDVWEYGCTLFECALGRPPNADLRERQQLKMRMRRLKQAISLPEKEQFSDGLRSLVQFSLNPDAASRPSMRDILQHGYFAGTEETHPSSSLTELVQYYYAWLFSGGQRVSLFMPGGAAPAQPGNDFDELTMSDEWNFSMTQDFEKRVSAIFEIPDLSNFSDNDFMEGESTPKHSKSMTLSPPKEMSASQRANFELRVQRGEGLANLFDQAKPAYEYKTKTDFIPVQAERRISDLPLRAMAEDRPSSIASNVIEIDLGDFDSDDYAIVAAPKTESHHIKTTTVPQTTPMREEKGFQLADVATIRAKRADSKGPRDPASLTARRVSDYDDDDSNDMNGSPTGIAAHDFADPQQEWTIRDRRPELQEAAEITPTVPTARNPRQTMEWSFAGAMSELTTDDADQLNLDHAASSSPPGINVTDATIHDTQKESKARKHATLEWSFSDAMAAAVDRDPTDEKEITRSTPKRPSPMLRTMTQPITQHEVQDAYFEDIPSRPDTALSFTNSESSQSSTDFDPFALERHGEMNDVIDSELDDMGVDSFYTTRGRTSATLSMNGPGPEEDQLARDLANLTMTSSIYHPPPTAVSANNRSLKVDDGEDSPGLTITANRLANHMRGGIDPNSAGGSGSSKGSFPHTNNILPPTSMSISTPNNGTPGPSTANNSISISTTSTTDRHRDRDTSSPTNSTTSTTGTRHSTSNSTFSLGFPSDPKPPLPEAMSGDADPELVERELERLLGEFQGALGAIGDVLSDGSRGRSPQRKGENGLGLGMSLNGLNGMRLGGSGDPGRGLYMSSGMDRERESGDGDEWEDEE